jgi:hypothetical protein
MNDAGGLMALTPTALLARALDEAVWRHLGTQTRFDADVFIDWLEVWINEGEAFTAERLLALDEDMLALCFGAVVRVEDSHVTAFVRGPDDAGEALDPGAGQALDPGAGTALIDRFLVTAHLEDEWDVIHAALMALWSHGPDRLTALLERLTLDDSRPNEELAHGVLHQDAAGAREAQQERAGFVPPSAAQAFLALARALSIDELVTMTDYDLETARHLRQIDFGKREGQREASATGPATDPEPSAGAAESATDTGAVAAHAGTGSGVAATAAAGLWTLLASAGIVDSPAVGRLTGPSAGSELVLARRLDRLAAADPSGMARVGTELAYLANVLLAGIDFPVTERTREDEARGLAFATANLGLELLEARRLDVALDEPPGLIRTFLVAWRTLSELPHHLVRAFEALFVSPDLTRSLERRRWLEPQMAESLDDLRDAVRTGDFDAAREALALLSLTVDTASCHAAAHLLALPPRFPELLDGGGRDAARWIATADDLQRVSNLLRGLRPKD